MFIKNGDAAKVTIVKTEELTEEQKKKIQEEKEKNKKSN
jgi:hypothetical protein